MSLYSRSLQVQTAAQPFNAALYFFSSPSPPSTCWPGQLALVVSPRDVEFVGDDLQQFVRTCVLAPSRSLQSARPT
jgi:hypothetical protein